MSILDRSLETKKMSGFIVHDQDVRDAKREEDKLLNMLMRIEFDKWPVIWLNRDNWLKRLLSYELASATGIFNTTMEVDASMRVSFSAQEMKETFRSWKRQKKLASVDFFNNPKMEVVYEDLLKNQGLNEILIFLGVDPMPLRTDLKKIVKGSTRARISNYSVLKMEMALTEWIRFFDE